MGNTQRTLRFQLPLQHGDCKTIHTSTERAFNRFHEDFISRTPTTKLLADFLKRTAKRIMADVTTCPPDTIGAHLTRLNDHTELCRLAMHHGLVDDAESRLSGLQLAHPATVMDFVACLDITRQQHRAPAFTNPVQEQFDRIETMIATLAALVAKKGGGL